MNIDLKLRTGLHVSMHDKPIWYTCIQGTRVLYADVYNNTTI